MDTVFSPEETAVLTFAIVALNGWSRLAVGLGSNVLGLDGLDLPGQAGGASSYLVIPEAGRGEAARRPVLACWSNAAA